MQFVKIHIESKARDVAEADALILEQNNMFRYLFVPALVDNQKNAANDIMASFIVQKKSKIDLWEKYSDFKLTDLKKDGWLNLSLSPSQLNMLLEYCNELKKEYVKSGKYDLFDSNRILIVDDGNYENLENLVKYICSKPDCLETIQRIINPSSDKVADFINKNYESMEKIIDNIESTPRKGLYSIMFAKTLNPEYFEKNLLNDSESFWQNLFEENPTLITSVVPAIIHFIEGTPYVGGKRINNQGGVFSDLMYSYGINNICLIEIKTPCTQLINRNQYRNNLYAPSSDLTGAIVQVQYQKDRLLKNYHMLREDTNPSWKVFDPRMVIIAGNLRLMNENEKMSFELFRSELKDVELITYDEIIEKMKLIIESMK